MNFEEHPFHMQCFDDNAIDMVELDRFLNEDFEELEETSFHATASQLESGA